MLGARYYYNTVTAIELQPSQLEARDRVNKNIEEGRYQLEQVQCAVCAGADFETLSEKDRYGIRHSTVLCRGCGLIQAAPRLTQDAYDDFYRTLYLPLTSGEQTPTENYFLDQYYRAHAVYRYLKPLFPKHHRDVSVFELGCSAGGILAYFRDRGCRIRGVDVNPTSTEFGRIHYGLNITEGRLAVCDFSVPADVVILSHVLEHLLTPADELSLIWSLLPENGILYVEVPGLKNLVYNFYDFDILRYLQCTHTYCFSLGSLQNLLIKHGFILIKGDEGIRAVFRKGHKSCRFYTVYKKDRLYVRAIEKVRVFLPITPFKIRIFFEKNVRRVLARMNLTQAAKKMYKACLHRTEPIRHENK